MNAVFVEAIFQSEWPNGRIRKVVVRIGRPVRAKSREWVCSVQISRLQKKIRVGGEDALQAVCLAIQLVGELLYKYRRAGIRLKYVPSNEEVPLPAYFRIKSFSKLMENRRRKRDRISKSRLV